MGASCLVVNWYILGKRDMKGCTPIKRPSQNLIKSPLPTLNRIKGNNFGDTWEIDFQGLVNKRNLDSHVHSLEK